MLLWICFLCGLIKNRFKPARTHTHYTQNEVSQSVWCSKYSQVYPAKFNHKRIPCLHSANQRLLRSLCVPCIDLSFEHFHWPMSPFRVMQRLNKAILKSVISLISSNCYLHFGDFSSQKWYNVMLLTGLNRYKYHPSKMCQHLYHWWRGEKTHTKNPLRK